MRPPREGGRRTGPRHTLPARGPVRPPMGGRRAHRTSPPHPCGPPSRHGAGRRPATDQPFVPGWPPGSGDHPGQPRGAGVVPAAQRLALHGQGPAKPPVRPLEGRRAYRGSSRDHCPSQRQCRPHRQATTLPGHHRAPGEPAGGPPRPAHTGIDGRSAGGITAQYGRTGHGRPLPSTHRPAIRHTATVPGGALPATARATHRPRDPPLTRATGCVIHRPVAALTGPPPTPATATGPRDPLAAQQPPTQPAGRTTPGRARTRTRDRC